MRGARAALLALALAATAAAAARPARAGGLTETLPTGTFMLEEAFYVSSLSHMYDNDGNLTPLIPTFERYEPGGGWQGTIVPDAQVSFYILTSQLQYGITDYLTVGIGIPVVLATVIEPSLGWIQGDYQQTLGRPYSADDFWQWAESMGQPRPGRWRGNVGALSDIILGVRYRFTDHVPWFRRTEWAMALTVTGSLPTGRPAEPEQVVSAGTTSWELHTQGELCFHLSIDKFFERHLDGRLILSLDLFYEVLFRHEYRTATGSDNPLLLTYAPYVGDTYTIDPGDFFGGSFQVEVVPYRGPALPTWIVRGDRERAAALPPLVSFWLRFTHIQLGQSDWESDSALWDWTREEPWRPGYKNILTAQLTLSLLRVGAPLQIFARYRNLSWITGRNSRAADVWTVGIQIPAKFW